MARKYYGIDKKSKMEHVVSAVTHHQDLYKQDRKFVGYYLVSCLFGLLGFGWFYLLPVTNTNIFMMGLCVGIIIPFFILSLISGIKVMTFARMQGLKQYRLNLFSVFINILILVTATAGLLWYLIIKK